MSLKEIKQLKIPESKEEEKYNKKRYSKAVSKMTRNVFKMIKTPTEFINEFEELMQEGVRLNILTKEEGEKHKRRLYEELSKPSQFKEDVKRQFEKARDKLFKKRTNKK